MEEQIIANLMSELKAIKDNHKTSFYSLLLYDAAKRTKRRNIISFVAEGSFRGNSKYAFIGVTDIFRERGIDCETHWMGGPVDKQVLTAAGYSAFQWGKPYEAADKAIHSKAMIYGNFDWANEKSFERQLCAAGARRIYLGHGIPAKYIGYAQIHTRQNIYAFAGMAHETLGYTDVVSESRELESTYEKAFPSADIHHLGSARNDIFATTGDLPKILLHGLNKEHYSAVKQARRDGKKVIFYAPTYREKAQGLATYMQAVRAFYATLEGKDEWFVVAKYHPGFKNFASEDTAEFYDPKEHILLLTDRDDINPYLRETDLLITDYSSVYYDYLLLDRPIVFFQPDLDEYEKARPRNLYPIADEVTVGPVCQSAADMVGAIQSELDNQDRHAADRQKFCRFLHQHGNDGKAATRLADFLIATLNLKAKQ